MRGGSTGPDEPRSTGRILRAWLPFGILSLTVLAWGLPAVKGAINQATTPVWSVPLLDGAISRAAPIVAEPTPEAARYDFNWLSATGTGCFLAAIVSGLLLGLGPAQLARLFWGTLKRMRLAIGDLLHARPWPHHALLPGRGARSRLHAHWLAAPAPRHVPGWLGVALTGSDTSSNALFGSLQRITADQLRLDSADVRGQLGRRRDGDGRRAVDHHRDLGDQPGRQRGAESSASSCGTRSRSERSSG